MPWPSVWSAGDTGLSVVVRLLGVGIEGVLGVMLIRARNLPADGPMAMEPDFPLPL